MSTTERTASGDPILSKAVEVESDAISSPTHGKNFSLKDFFKTDATSLSGRVRPFSEYYRQARGEGLLQYGREIVSSVEHRTSVRSLDGSTREMIMLGSNNYLGLTTHPTVIARIKRALDEFGAGMGGPPLLGGMSQLHIELEARLSAMKGSEDTMLYGSGYQANLGWVTTLLRNDDVLLYDEYSHASLYDGIALTVSGVEVKAIRFAHNDVEHLEKLLIRARKDTSKQFRQIFVAVEGVYSMDGDLAPLPELSAVCHKYDAILMVDDAHSTGVMGKTGGGTGEHFDMHAGGVDMWMGSFSKALGMSGGFISASREIIDYLRFCSRSYVFSAHLPITTIAGVLGGLDVMEAEPELFVRLHENADYLVSALQSLGFNTQHQAAIIPVLVPEGINIREVCRLFDQNNIFLNSIEYPAVSLDGQRLRLSVMATHTKEDLDIAIDAFARIGKQVGMIGS